MRRFVCTKKQIGMKKLDKNGREVKPGDIINLHQTVNGQNLFVVLSIEPLDVRYSHDLTYKYQYDQGDLFVPCKYTGDVEFEIISNLYDLMPDVSY